MDRVTQLRGGAGGSRDSTLDSSFTPSEAYMTASEGSSSKFFSVSEHDFSFDLSPLKDVSLASAAAPEKPTTETDDLSNLSPISKKTDTLDSYKFGKQIEAANILSGGVNIFDDNDSYDGDELVIDDNAVVLDDKIDLELKEAKPVLPFQKADDISEGSVIENEAIASKDTEVVLQIDGTNVNAIYIGNGIYLFRKEGEEELEALQIVDDDQQHPSFKFLKVRENAEGNLEVYEEIEKEVPQEVPTKEGKTAEKNTSHVPFKDINKVISNTNCSKIVKRTSTPPLTEPSPAKSINLDTIPETKVSLLEAKLESNKNIMMTYNETKKSPFIHSTPNKEGIPLTKVMVNQQLHPNRHSDKVKTIEVHTENIKQKGDSIHNKYKELPEPAAASIAQKEKLVEKCLDMAENDNVEVTENHSKNQEETSISGTIYAGEDTEKELNTSAKKDIGSIEKPIAKKNSVINKKTDTNTIAATKIENYIKIVKDIPDYKDAAVENKSNINVVSAVENNKIVNETANTEYDSRNNKNQEKSIDKSNYVIIPKPIDKTSIEKGTKPSETSIKKDDECDPVVRIVESSIDDKSESQINIFGPEPKQKEDLKNKETKNIEQLESKNIVTKNVSVAPHLNKSLIAKLDDNTIDKNLKVSSIVFEENIHKTGNELHKNIKSENKNQCPDSGKEVDKLTKMYNTELKHHKTVAADKTSQYPKNADKQIDKTDNKEKEALLAPTVMNQFLQQSPQKINNESLIQCDSILADQTKSLKLANDKDAVYTENRETSKETIVQVLTKTSKLQSYKELQTLKVITESHIREKSNTKESTKPFVISPVSTCAQIQQREKEKKEIVAAKSISTDNKICFSEVIALEDKQIKLDIPTKRAESLKKQNAPLKPLTDSTLKAKEDTVTKEAKKEVGIVEIHNSPQKHHSNAQNVASASSPSSLNVDEVKKETAKDKPFEPKPINNNTAVPFGKWTEANRQEFLNKIKESKVPSCSSNTKQIKQPNDLNRLDVLQKIDSQRQIHSAAGKVDLAAANKLTIKNETKKYTVKPIVSKDSNIPVKTETLVVKRVSTDSKKPPKQEVPPKHFNMPNTTFSVSPAPNTESATKEEGKKRKGINNQDLIDKTIEDIINRAIPGAQQDDTKSSVVKESTKSQKPKDTPYAHCHQSKESQLKSSSPLDFIEMKMNELHGIPFVERPPHELPKVYNRDIKTYGKQDSNKSPVKKVSQIPNLVPFSTVNQAKISQEKVIEVDSEEEIIEHEPITGDIELNTVNAAPKTFTNKEATTDTVAQAKIDNSKKETIITENDFDKFARRNSITYENCLTVNFEGRKKPNVVHTVKEKDAVVIPSQAEVCLANTKHKVTPKQLVLHQNKHSSKIQITSKLMSVNEDVHNKNYPSKLQMAYQSALTAKRQTKSPITIIEDRPVKVVYMDVQSGFSPSELNVQGKDLSPTKKQTAKTEVALASSCDSVDSDMIETIIDVKSQDKNKTKHQRKQVLTPVDNPELVLIEPSDLSTDHSPKKKRKTDDIKSDKSPKSSVPKKTYLLCRGMDDRESYKNQDNAITKSSIKELADENNTVLTHNATASAIDNLVKAAELLETQSENLNSSTISMDSDSQKSTPAKRGRGRPRKYPLPDTSQDGNKTSSPQKKSQLIDAKKSIVDTVSDDDDSSDEGIVQENWTMGKINENIVCPICNKLFRSENVVFKHVKHCTGPSPNRSESDKRSPPRISRETQGSDSKSSRESQSNYTDYEPEKMTANKETSKKQNSIAESSIDKLQVIVIEDLPVVEKPESSSAPKQHESRKRSVKSKLPLKGTNLACEICGKIFRQLSYLVNHKLQHKKDDGKKTETIIYVDKSVFTCEICKKEFRKLHHMVQHRFIHNPSSAPTRISRKSSSEQNFSKEQNASKQPDDQNAAFRCEPCDKSFRKLHHLVEHRETHVGINRQKVSSNAQMAIEKSPPPPPQCEICKKTFRRLHHLIEHKEQHQETSSEKSDDRSVKSALSTKDIIHECSLCYMVFPNEHSLNKHSVICQRKKRQSAAKQNKPVEVTYSTQENDKTPEANKITPKPVEEKSAAKQEEEFKTLAEKNPLAVAEKAEEVEKVSKTHKQNKTADKRLSNENEVKITESKPMPVKRDSVKSDDSNSKVTNIVPDTPKKRKVEDDNINADVIVIEDKPKKKSPKPNKDKIPPNVTKRRKTINRLLPIIDEKVSTAESSDNEKVSTAESSDNEDVRYMLNPNFKADETAKGKLFMKVRANKRNSLPLERPSSKKIFIRTLQHPSKIWHLKPKTVESRASSTSTVSTLAKIVKPAKMVSIVSTDSDDSDVKYSFPETVVADETSQILTDVAKTLQIKRKSLTDKRKSLGSIAKRKSAGKPILPKLKAQAKLAPAGDVKIRRRQEVDYRCDCGQLFNSAALLSRHTTLDHTPPRIRRRRSPPPEVITKPTKPAPRKSTSTDKPTSVSRKSSIRSETNANTNAKKLVADKNKAKMPGGKRKSTAETSKPVRTAAHRGVPVPEKMKKLRDIMGVSHL